MKDGYRGAYVEYEERVGAEQRVEYPSHVLDAPHIVRQPGDEPARTQRDERDERHEK